MPGVTIFDGPDGFNTPREEYRGSAGAVFKDCHALIQEVFEEVDCRVGEPWDLKVERRFGIQDVVRQATRDVLRMQNEVGNDSSDFLRNSAMHNGYRLMMGDI